MIAPMVSIRPGPTAVRNASRWAAGRGNACPRPSIRAISTSRSLATNAAIQEPVDEYPGGIPPVPVVPRTSLHERKEAMKSAKPFSDFLTDSFNRQHDYLRISITERCNLRCLYCMPEEGIQLSPPAHLLTTPEIFYLSSLFVSQGVTKIRLTGGEPTVRRDIVPLMQSIGTLRSKGLRELALTTNGISLHRKLDSMVEAGLTGVNLSLDTLDPFQFQIMTRRNGFDAVMKCINRILELKRLGADLKLKINCVVMRGLNERDIIPFVELGREKDVEVRFIEYMPFGGNKWSEGKMISFQEMLDTIRTKYPELRRVPGHKNDTSKTFEVPGFVGKVGFITSMTNDFCGTCNRLRITSDGNLKVCLHGNAEVSLRDLLRQDNGGRPIDQEAFERIKQIEMDRREGRLTDETILGWGQRESDLLHVIGAAVKRKAEKHADIGDLENMKNRPMILIEPPKEGNYLPARPIRSILQSTPRTRTSSPEFWPTVSRLPFLYPSFTPPVATTFARPYSTYDRNDTHGARRHKPHPKRIKGGTAEARLAMSEARKHAILQKLLRRTGKIELPEPEPVEKWRLSIEKKRLVKGAKDQYIATGQWPEQETIMDRFARLKEERAARREETSRNGPERKMLAGTNSIASLMGDIAVAPPTHPRLLKKVINTLQSKIIGLEARIDLETQHPPWKDAGRFDSFKQLAESRSLNRPTTRAIWRARKKAAEALRKLEAKARSAVKVGELSEEAVESVIKRRIEELDENRERDIAELKTSLAELRMHLATIKEEEGERQARLKELEQQKEELLRLRKEKMEKMREYEAVAPLREMSPPLSTSARQSNIPVTSWREPRMEEPIAPSSQLRDAAESSPITAQPLVDSDADAQPKRTGVEQSYNPRNPSAMAQLRAKRDALLQQRDEKLEERKRIQKQPSTESARAQHPSLAAKSSADRMEEDLKNIIPDRKPSKHDSAEDRLHQMQHIAQTISFLKEFRARAGFEGANLAMADKAAEMLESLQQEVLGLPQEQTPQLSVSDSSALEKPSLIRFTNDARPAGAARLDPTCREKRKLNSERPTEPLNPFTRYAKHGLQRDDGMVWNPLTEDVQDAVPRWAKEPRTTPHASQASKRMENAKMPVIDIMEPIPSAPYAKTDKPASVVIASLESIKFGESHKPDPIPPTWPEPRKAKAAEPSLRRASQEQKPFEKSDSQAPSPLKRPEPQSIHREDLESNTPTEGVQVLDSELFINYDTPISSLQSQLYHLHSRLKTSYPKIDSLPYDVWTSSNQNVLRTWLKILAKRWEARFDSVDFDTDAQVEQVLDQMVQQHDLSNDAAKRMASRFVEVFGKRGKMSSEVGGGGLNWDEFDAEMGSWLRDDETAEPHLEAAVGVSGNTSKSSSVSKSGTGIPKSLPFYLGSRSQSGFKRADSAVTRQFSTTSVRCNATDTAHPPMPPQEPRIALDAIAPSSKTKPAAAVELPNALPHLTPSGSAHMVSVSTKPPTDRTAIAVGTVHFSNPSPLSLIRSNSLKKGDVLSVARIAGIMAAKKCPDLIPLCHPIMLSHVDVSLRLFEDGKDGAGFGGVEIMAKVECTGATGVEMEALTSVMGAGLTVVDMCKAVDKGMRVEGVRVVLKEGGRSGTFRDEGWVEWIE